jgi:uncharacterized protein (DUF169 family)
MSMEVQDQLREAHRLIRESEMMAAMEAAIALHLAADLYEATKRESEENR